MFYGLYTSPTCPPVPQVEYLVETDVIYEPNNQQAALMGEQGAG